MKTKLITGRYKGYEVCYANKGQIFPRDGWYLTKGDDVIYIEDAIAQTREETINDAIKKIEKIKIAVAKQTGAYKYNSCYEDCIDILNKLKK